MKDVHELPKDIKEFLVREIPNFRKYNPSTLPSGKDLWDLYEDYVKELWYWYKEYQRSEQPTQYDNACEMASICLLYTSPSPRDGLLSRMPSSA